VRCEQFLTGSSEEMPDDPTVASSQQGTRFVPCNALACRTCGAAVVHIDDLAHPLGRGAALTEAVDALDPLAFVRVSHFAQGSRLYACRCSATSVEALTDTGRLDLHDIDTWACAGHPPPARHPRVRPYAEVLPAAVASHLRGGGWLLLGDGALEGRGDDGAWLWPFDGGDARALAEPEVTARVSRLVAQLPRWTARQVAPPCFASPPQFAMFLEGWKHGDLDSQSCEGRFADAASLVTAIRARASSLPAPHSIAYRLAPGLLTLSGHLAFVDHLP
jgi:hypothetical protein